VEEQSGGRLDPTTGALYQALRRLTEDGLIAPAEGPGDARRNYFALTRQGRRAAANEAKRLDALVRAARQRKLYPQRA
jgi:DNA-binding PadR family transcriptional regulator